MRCMVPLLVVALVAITAQAAVPVSPADRRFALDTSQDLLFEARAGQLAAERGGSQDIRDEGLSDAHDHNLANDVLRTAAAGVPLPDALGPELQSRLDRLHALSGTAFDAAFLREMQTLQIRDAGALATEARSGLTPQLRAFAAETVRIIQRHLGALNAAEAE